MGLTSVVQKQTRRIAIALAITCAIGCQHGVAPVQLSVAPEEPSVAVSNHAPAEQKETPYVNPNWVEEEPPTDLIETAIHKSTTIVNDVFSPLIDNTETIYKIFSGENASLANRQLHDSSSADNRRIGINKLVDFGFLKQDTPREKKRAENFETVCRGIVRADSDFTVRATAIRTGNRGRDARGTSLYIQNLVDKNELVRLEAAKALANIPDVNAVPALITALTNPAETRDVRIAAADALKHYRTLPAERALCSMLHDRSFAVAWQARRSLRYLTSRDYRYDEAAWLGYFTGTGKS